MTAGMTKTWLDATAEQLQDIAVSTGVYEVRAHSGEVLTIGYAGTHEVFGLRSKLGLVLAGLDDKVQFRYEQHVIYQTRFVEIVLDHRARHGSTPGQLGGPADSVAGRLSVAL